MLEVEIPALRAVRESRERKRNRARVKPMLAAMASPWFQLQERQDKIHRPSAVRSEAVHAAALRADHPKTYPLRADPTREYPIAFGAATNHSRPLAALSWYLGVELQPSNHRPSKGKTLCPTTQTRTRAPASTPVYRSSKRGPISFPDTKSPSATPNTLPSAPKRACPISAPSSSSTNPIVPASS